MEVTIANKPKKKNIDWVTPHSDKVTWEEYCSEMKAAENAESICFEDHKNNMHQWLKTKL